jgi:hypothetical protein
MLLAVRGRFCAALALCLVTLLAVPQSLRGQDHVVSPADLQKEVRAAAEARQANLAKVERLFSAEPVKKALTTAKIDPAKVGKAVSILTDEELARVAAQADRMQADLAAGALTNQEITYILIALATAVVILVIVEAR